MRVAIEGVKMTTDSVRQMKVRMNRYKVTFDNGSALVFEAESFNEAIRRARRLGQAGAGELVSCQEFWA